MNDAPIRPLPGQAPPSGGNRTCLYACLILFALGAIGMFALVAGGFFFIRGMVLELSDEEPIAFPEVVMAPEDRDALFGRIERFVEAAEAGEGGELTLNSDEINVILRHYPDLEEIGRYAHVNIEEGKVRGQVSFPLAQVGIPGRYVNGSAVFSVSLADGRALVFLDELDVGGRGIPDAAFSQLQGENLAADFNRDPEFRHVIERIESLDILDDEIRLRLRPSEQAE